MTSGKRFLLSVGSLGPIGKLPASGSASVALIGLPLFALSRELSPIVYSALVVAFILLAVWIHDAGDKWLGEKDSPQLVWDELAGFFVAVAFVPFTWPVALIAFFLERTLDIGKIPPANLIERYWRGGWGVVGDDVVAGIYTNIALHLLLYLAPSIGR